MSPQTINFKHFFLMGILNTTPDSFSDGGKFVDAKSIHKRIDQMIIEGVDILDIGGESSAPNSPKVSQKEEIKRIIPALKYCNKKKFLVSVDTYKSGTANFALQNGAQIINDVTAFRGDTKLASVIAKHNAYVVIMYSKDNSARTTRKNKTYQNVIEEIKTFLEEKIEYALTQGIAKEKIIIDPGMGAFVSKNPKPSLEILKNLEDFKPLDCPILIGASRKSFVGQILDLPIQERLEGSLAAAAIAVYNGAKIIRAHDVKETKRVIKISRAIKSI